MNLVTDTLHRRDSMGAMMKIHRIDRPRSAIGRAHSRRGVLAPATTRDTGSTSRFTTCEPYPVGCCISAIV